MTHASRKFSQGYLWTSVKRCICRLGGSISPLGTMLLTSVIDHFTERASKKWQVLGGYFLKVAGSDKTRPHSKQTGATGHTHQLLAIKGCAIGDNRRLDASQELVVTRKFVLRWAYMSPNYKKALSCYERHCGVSQPLR